MTRSIPEPPMRSTPPDPEPDTIWRSPASVAPATRHPSPVAADAVRVGDAHRVEEHLVEVDLAADVAQRSDLDPGRVQVDDEVGEAATLRHVRVGAGQADREVREVRPRGPDLLAAEHPLLAVERGPGGQRREVGARARLAQQLAPLLLVAHERREEAEALLLGAVGEQRRRRAVQPERVEPAEVERREHRLGDRGPGPGSGRARRTPPATSRRPARCRRASGTTPRTPPGSAPGGSRPAHRRGRRPARRAGTCSVTQASTVLRTSSSEDVRSSGKWSSAGTRPYRTRMAERNAEGITDEGVERLRARVGIARPHTQPPHYRFPNEDTFRNVAEAYGDDNPLWAEPDYARGTRWGGAIASPHLVGGDTLIGEDEVRELPTDVAAQLRGDPIRGAHAFYAGSSREWWAPLRPGRRLVRRNALVGVHDKQSDFAERAIHEWTAEVFASRDPDEVLAAQYRLMIRTDRKKAEQRGKNDAIVIDPYTDEQIAEIDAVSAAETTLRRGAEPRWWEDVKEGDEVGPLVKGPLRVTDMVCWHVGMGMGLYGVKALRLGYDQRQRVPRFFRPDDLNIPDVQQRVHWDPGVGAQGRQPGELRLRPDARDVADPPVHGLDGRRRVALEARLPVPQVQLRG